MWDLMFGDNFLHNKFFGMQNGDMLDEDEPVDIEGDGDGDGNDMEDYEWIAQRKARHGLPGMSSTYSRKSANRRNGINGAFQCFVMLLLLPVPNLV